MLALCQQTLFGSGLLICMHIWSHHSVARKVARWTGTLSLVFVLFVFVLILFLSREREVVREQLQ